jgi:uncharacterized damage-inducible protein DinB
MKNYFARLFNYDKFANELMIKQILENNSTEKPAQLMAHLLAVQQVWYNRCNNLLASATPMWPDWKAESLKQIARENSEAWSKFIAGLDEADFEKPVHYQNSRGDAFGEKLVDILTQLTNHGTHHRAQAGQHLKLAGLENLPLMDYILYVRTFPNN